MTMLHKMGPVCNKINELMKLLGINGELASIYGNAQNVPALDSCVTKVLIRCRKVP